MNRLQHQLLSDFKPKASFPLFLSLCFVVSACSGCDVVEGAREIRDNFAAQQRLKKTQDNDRINLEIAHHGICTFDPNKKILSVIKDRGEVQGSITITSSEFEINNKKYPPSKEELTEYGVRSTPPYIFYAIHGNCRTSLNGQWLDELCRKISSLTHDVSYPCRPIPAVLGPVQMRKDHHR